MVEMELLAKTGNNYIANIERIDRIASQISEKLIPLPAVAIQSNKNTSCSVKANDEYRMPPLFEMSKLHIKKNANPS